jgi:hypothetical protein
VSANVLVPWFGRSSVGVLDLKFCAIHHTGRIFSFFQICSLSLILPKMLPFLPKTYQTRKIQKESKIAQTNKTKKLTNIN